MPDLDSRSDSLVSRSARADAGMMLAWSTTLPVSAGKLAASAASPNETISAKAAPVNQATAVEERRRTADDQNLTAGGVWAVSLTVNSAIGLFARKAVIAHSTPGKVLSPVL